MSWLEALCGRGPAPALPPTLVVVAHPDDETVGAASRLPRLAGGRFVYVTDGAPADGLDAARHGLSVDGYRQLRRQERAAALGLCGIGPGQVVELGCADQCAARELLDLAMRLTELFIAERPQAVLTHPYEGGHPDHDATAFAVHAAAGWLRRHGRTTPALYEMTFYHQGPAGLQAGVFLPGTQADRELRTVELDASEQALRQALLSCYASQRDTLAQFPRDVERFRPAPGYDFRRPPHAGSPYYEAQGWGGWTAAAFSACCAAAMAELDLDGPL